TFVAILELMREGLIDVVQTEPFGPLHVRAASPGRMLRVVGEDEPAVDGADEPPADVEAAGESPFAEDEAVSAIADTEGENEDAVVEPEIDADAQSGPPDEGTHE